MHPNLVRQIRWGDNRFDYLPADGLTYGLPYTTPPTSIGLCKIFGGSEFARDTNSTPHFQHTLSQYITACVLADIPNL